ncbi:MAG TPA: tRNA (adenosine(37)-N6)-threonylcarbamoyltransferase complex ATPase subunit type 1 TsaE [Mucilaginibacter sp.]|nr:tRNA (adenosine(37)-N6)-threonylcarbamoyltransferase complex ATPase subunit type 1 TsaE [Mucilaginibacter sp.]
MMHLTATTPAQLPDIATQLLAFAKDTKIFLFYGDMGAGKTTLIKALCEQLGVSSPATSPTFSIVNEYTGTDDTIFHFDFYRLKTETEALDLGYEEYFYSGAFCFIEWPEKISGLLPDHYVRVSISVQNDGSREVAVEQI